MTLGGGMVVRTLRRPRLVYGLHWHADGSKCSRTGRPGRGTYGAVCPVCSGPVELRSRWTLVPGGERRLLVVAGPHAAGGVTCEGSFARVRPLVEWVQGR